MKKFTSSLIAGSAAIALGLSGVGVTVASAAGSKSVTGPDISHHQGDWNFSQMKSKGYDFIFIRATRGKTQDTKFDRNWKQSEKGSYVRGTYHFGEPYKYSGAEEAKYYLANGGKWKKDGRTLPGVLDLEESPSAGKKCQGKTPAELRKYIKDFSSTYEKSTGRKPMIYTNGPFMENCVKPDAKLLKGTQVWFAHWNGGKKPNLPTGVKSWTFHQYTNSGGKLDLNRFNGSESELKKLAAGKTSSKPTPKPSATPTKSKTATPKPSPSKTKTASPKPSPSKTRTATPKPTSTKTATPKPTPSESPTQTVVPTAPVPTLPQPPVEPTQPPVAPEPPAPEPQPPAPEPVQPAPEQPVPDPVYPEPEAPQAPSQPDYPAEEPVSDPVSDPVEAPADIPMDVPMDGPVDEPIDEAPVPDVPAEGPGPEADVPEGEAPDLGPVTPVDQDPMAPEEGAEPEGEGPEAADQLPADESADPMADDPANGAPGEQIEGEEVPMDPTEGEVEPAGDQVETSGEEPSLSAGEDDGAGSAAKVVLPLIASLALLGGGVALIVSKMQKPKARRRL